jgi:hypothetical protein
VGAESRLKRWFGKEHNPKRAALVRQGIRLQLAADAAAGLAVLAWIEVSAAAGVALLVLAACLLGLSGRRLVEARREPHWGSRAGALRVSEIRADGSAAERIRTSTGLSPPPPEDGVST